MDRAFEVKATRETSFNFKCPISERGSMLSRRLHAFIVGKNNRLRIAKLY